MIIEIELCSLFVLAKNLKKLSGTLLTYFVSSIAGGADGPDKVFVGGLPYYLTEVQIKELLESFGYVYQ